jgi:hypothetical protein
MTATGHTSAFTWWEVVFVGAGPLSDYASLVGEEGVSFLEVRKEQPPLLGPFGGGRGGGTRWQLKDTCAFF